MSALPLILTTAGRDALINAQSTGVSNVVIASIGLSATQTALSAATLVIPDEFKRIAGVGGQVVAPETFYVAATDTSADTYSVRTVGLYLSDGVLLGGYSQEAVLLEKAAPAMGVIEASVRLTEPLAAVIDFTGGGWDNPPASETVEGVIRLATQAEVASGTNATRAVTPKWLKALLDPLFAGKADADHTHDAAAVNSGTFALARIPDLTMAKVSGLVAALAGKAASVHYHVIGDVADLSTALAGKAAAVHGHAMAEITGLAAALAGKSDTGHNHDAAAVNSGTLAVARVPDLTMAKITGLAAALAGKSDTGHSHPMADITGLTLALSLKLNGSDFNWPTLVGKPDVAVKHTDTIFNSLQLIQGGNPVVGRIYLGDQSGGGRQLIYTGAAYDLSGADLYVNGGKAWTDLTFDPASRAPVVHTHTAAEIVDLLDAVYPAGELKMFDMASPPAGLRVLVADGSTVSRVTYARLFAAIGTRYGAGDGATTFALPDWRGLFFRGLDNGRGLDPGRALGTFQDSDNKAHTHAADFPAGADNGASGIDSNFNWSAESRPTSSSGGAEARPVNQALLACITY